MRIVLQDRVETESLSFANPENSRKFLFSAGCFPRRFRCLQKKSFPRFTEDTIHTLPAFLIVDDGIVAVVGATAAAESKVAILEQCGIPVRRISDRVPDESEIEGAVAVVAAAGSELDERTAALAKQHKIPINVVDRPELSSFSFPAIVNRGDVIVAIGTGGASPVLARRLRERIEAILPFRLDALAKFLRHWRDRLKAVHDPRAHDRRFWESVIDGPVQQHVLAGRTADADRAMRESVRRFAPPSGGVTLVGAGPGDPELVTLKGLRALQEADVVFHDELVTPEILALARRDAAKVFVGKREGRPGVAQSEINAHLIREARKGRRVVRLKGGDPFIFGRGGEEVEALRAVRIPVTIVPGITAALGCAAESELPLTFRNEATRLLIATARTAEGAPADWRGTNIPGSTLVVYMGSRAAAAVRDGLIGAGWSGATPAAVLARGTRPDSLAVTGALAELPGLAARAGDGPAILVIGDVVTHARPRPTSRQLEAAA